MAKMFYTMEETKTALGKNEEEVKQLARENRLREFRDGPRLMFKADQVEQIKGELASGGGESGEISLAPAEESGAPIEPSDSRAASAGSVLGLVDTASGRPAAKEDTQLADLGLSGSIGGVPSPGSGDSATGSRSGSRGGLVLDVDEARRAEPNAQTAISGGVGDQISLEAAGSGSGLLDLTRESDDTSLGAVFDELTPSGAGARRAAQVSPTAAMETHAGEDLPAVEKPARAQLTAPVFVTGPDAWGAALGFAALAATVILCFGAFVLISTVLGFRPGIMDDLRTSGTMYLAVAAGVTVVFTVAGFFVGKAAK